MTIPATSESEPQTGAAAPVLVVDDSATIRRSAEAILRAAGYPAVSAVDGFEALAEVAERHPRLILIDVMMPRLDGFQACSLIKSNPRYRATPVVMLTSRDGLFDRARGRLAGCDDYLTKPFTRDELLEVIRRYVGEPETPVSA